MNNETPEEFEIGCNLMDGLVTVVISSSLIADDDLLDSFIKFIDEAFEEDIKKTIFSEALIYLKETNEDCYNFLIQYSSSFITQQDIQEALSNTIEEVVVPAPNLSDLVHILLDEGFHQSDYKVNKKTITIKTRKALRCLTDIFSHDTISELINVRIP